MKELNDDTNELIHDGRLSLTTSGRPFIILREDHYNTINVERANRIALTAKSLMEKERLIVKNEKEFSDELSSRSSKKSIESQYL